MVDVTACSEGGRDGPIVLRAGTAGVDASGNRIERSIDLLQISVVLRHVGQYLRYDRTDNQCVEVFDLLRYVVREILAVLEVNRSHNDHELSGGLFTDFLLRLSPHFVSDSVLNDIYVFVREICLVEKRLGKSSSDGFFTIKSFRSVLLDQAVISSWIYRDRRLYGWLRIERDDKFLSILVRWMYIHDLKL